MKHIFLSLIIIFCSPILRNDANASNKELRVRAASESDLHEGLFKSARLGTQEFTLNRIANLPKIFECGTPIEQGRIVATLNKMDEMLSAMSGLLGDVLSYINNPELSSNLKEDEVAQIGIYLDAIQLTKNLFTSPTPPTINLMIANLSAINGYLRVSQKRLVKYLKDLSLKIQTKTDSFLTSNASLPLNCISANSFQQVKSELSQLESLKTNIFRTLQDLSKYYDMNQSFLLILSDFYLQPRNPVAARICSTDQYLSYLNHAIEGGDIVNRSGHAVSVY